MPLADDRPTPQSSAQGLVAARLTPESAASRTAESQNAASLSPGVGESAAPGRSLAPVSTLGSLGLSLVSHAIVAALFGLVTWSVGSIVRAAPPEIHAQIVAADVPAGSGGFRFPGSALIDRPDSATAAGAPAPAASLADLIANQTPPD
ncbi:MAG: hypothetical protein B6D36_11240, partial [Planctomycetes bacterium UTPLA1]